jgi:hypothetical protein
LVPVLIFCTSGLIFDGTEGVGFRFHVLRARTRFRRYRGHQVLFSCFACPNLFSAIPRASAPVFMFCAPGLVFGGSECVGSRFHVLRVRTRFQQYQGSRVPFSCFARSDSFSAVPRVSGPVFMFCATGHVFSGAEFVGSRFHVLRSQTRFRQNGCCRVPFSFFTCPDSFSVVPRVPGPVFMFCAPEGVSRGTKGVGSRFHVLRSRTRFLRNQGCMILFSCFARTEKFSAVPRASGPIFMFCTPGLVCGGTEGVGSHFLILRSRTHFRRYQGRPVPFSCFARPFS